ncbi:MAG: sporulation peptidase YabG, partial [Paraclostridium sp.]
NSYGMPGKVLHIDGDPEYLKICLDVYTKLGIPAIGKSIPENLQYKEIRSLLEKYNPSILVITGHDAIINSKGSLKDIKNYKNTNNFIKTVREARKYDASLDGLVIFAGACQSNYEEIIKAGANFASSPSRVMIHALDPLLVVEKIACARIDKIVPLEEVLGHTVTGLKGVGGIETKGKYRMTMPVSIYGSYEIE